MYRFVNNSAGWRELFTSSEMLQLCQEAAQKVAADANSRANNVSRTECEPYVPHAHVHANTCVGRVACKKTFLPLESKYGCLKKSIE